MHVPTCTCLRQGQQEGIRKECGQEENRHPAVSNAGPSLRASLARTRLLAQILLHVMCLHACANLHLPPARPAGGNQERVRPGGEQASSCFQCWPLSAGELGSHPLVSADSAACNVPPCMCQLAPASGKASRRESGKSATRRRTGIQLLDLPAPLCGRAWLAPAC